jgi:hypothetical protein
MEINPISLKTVLVKGRIFVEIIRESMDFQDGMMNRDYLLSREVTRIGETAKYS